MALGRREEERQQDLWVASKQLPKSPGHVFYRKLNELLAEAGFDRWVEELCRPLYARLGRPGIPPGVYFRMLLVGYFEGIGSQFRLFPGGRRGSGMYVRYDVCSSSVASSAAEW